MVSVLSARFTEPHCDTFTIKSDRLNIKSLRDEKGGTKGEGKATERLRISSLPFLRKLEMTDRWMRGRRGAKLILENSGFKEQLGHFMLAKTPNDSSMV